jgi:CheY-like chemotaxis protein
MQTAPHPIRLLHLEDSEPDHALAMAYLRRSGMELDARRIETRGEFAAALAKHWDVVLSDYHLPGFSGVEALQLLRERMAAGGRPVPFILVSGQIGEDTAVEAMRNGAADYLLKANLARLAPAVEHAIAANDAQRARQQADRALQDSRRRLSELAQHLQTSVEAERHAIAREIHDDVGGSLTALKFELDWIRRHAAEPAVQQRAVSALETVTGAIEASQRIMQNLRPAILEQGLVAALQWMTSRFEKRTGVECEFRTNGLSQERRACRRRAAGGLPHGAGSADQRHQTRRRHPRGGGLVHHRRRAVAGNQRQRPRPGHQRPGQGAQLWHPRPARTRLHRGRLGGPEQRSAGTSLILSVPLDDAWPRPAPSGLTTWTVPPPASGARMRIRRAARPRVRGLVHPMRRKPSQE